MNYIELKNHLNNALQGNDKFSPVYVLTNSDEYLQEQAVKMFKNILDKEFYEFNLAIYSQEDFSDAIDALYTFPVFDTYKVVFVNVSSALSDEQKQLLDGYTKEPNDGSILVFVVGEDAKFTLKGSAITTVMCEFESENDVYKEINNIVQEDPYRTINRDAASELIVRTQKNMTRIVSELKKLKSYKDDVITREDVIQMVTADIEYQTYELANALGDKNSNKALEVLNVFIKDGIKYTTILSSLYDKYRLMLHVSLNSAATNDEIAEVLGVKSGQIYYVRKVASNYSQMRLKRSVDYLHSLLIDTVSGRRQESSVIHEAVLQLLAL